MYNKIPIHSSNRRKFKKWKTSDADKNVEQPELLQNWWEDKYIQLLWEKVWQSLIK